MNGAGDAGDIMAYARQAAAERGVVVVGAGQAGGRFVEAIRANGFSGALTLVGSEYEPPYERPSLSKDMLVRDVEAITWVHPPGLLSTHQIAFHAGVRAVDIDRSARQVHLSDGRVLDYGVLVLATGARPRHLQVSGAAKAGCLYLRDLADSRVLRSRLQPERHVLVIGAGFIGLEVAAAAVERGCRVTLMEAAAVPVSRIAPAGLGAALGDLHKRKGVSLHFGARLERFEQDEGKGIAHTAAGESIAADVIVAGIGVVPNAELAVTAGLAVDGAVVTDAFGATSDPLIFAVGDVARQFSPLFGRHVTLESWQYAQNSAIALAKNLAGQKAALPYAEVPWFWSDQYGLNLQMFGLRHDRAREITREKPDGARLHFQTLDGQLVFAAGFNAARELRSAKDLIGSRVTVSDAELADPAFPLMDIARRAKQQRQVA